MARLNSPLFWCFVILFVLMMAGCATTIPPAPHIIYKNVEVPIISCPAPPIIPRPDLSALANINQNSSDDDVQSAYRVAIENLKEYARQLEVTLAAYQKIGGNSEDVVAAPITPGMLPDNPASGKPK